jgi:hypothetical protein
MKNLSAFILAVAIVLGFCVGSAFAQSSSAFKIARLKYSGGGDWYNGPTEEPNLLRYVKQNTLIDVEPTYEFVEIMSDKLFTYPFLFMTGHGNIVLSDLEVRRLRTYLENGGFLYADDDYGMDKAFRREIKRVFPDKDLVELPFSYGLYNCHFQFPGGPPKMHAHENKPAQGFGIFHNGRLVVYYTFESNPSDGWDDPDVHKDPPEKREEALRFGTNVIVWALTH